MNERSFQMQLVSHYEGTENTVTNLNIEVLEDGQWEDFDLNSRSPGFVIFVYAVFTCQHLYLRTNAAERGLLMDHAIGSIHMVTTEDWDLRRLHVRFDVTLVSGRASSDETNHIIGRMKQCPVSRNIRDIAEDKTELRFSY
ncbi:MAG: hypothetical protein GY807_18125 [Gammaproteobacteria bacterium]|nr:hypothetical protein [Gammaproteobacteria bacterium]